MKTRNFLIGTFLLAGIMTSISSCNKDDDTDSPQPTLEPIALDCDYFETNRTLTNDPDRAVDYFIDCVMEVEADIIINPGVVIKFGEAAGIEVKSTGSFSAEGVADNGILFTGAAKVKGSWKGIFFDSDDTDNRLHHTTVSYAGGGEFNSNGDLGAVILYADAKMDINYMTINNSAAHGFNANYINSTFDIENSIITDCDGAPVLITQSYLGRMGITNDYTGNAENYIHVEVHTDEIEENITIEDVSIPYRVFPLNAFYTDIVVGNGVTTIDKDITIEFTNGTGIFVDDNGTLDISSNGDNGVLFTGVNKQSGSWKGIYFEFTQGANTLDNLTIEYAGSESDGTYGGIQMWADPVLNLGNVTFSNITGCGVLDRPKTQMDPINPNWNDQGSSTYDNVSGGNYCKES